MANVTTSLIYLSILSFLLSNYVYEFSLYIFSHCIFKLSVYMLFLCVCHLFVCLLQITDSHNYGGQVPRSAMGKVETLESQGLVPVQGQEKTTSQPQTPVRMNRLSLTGHGGGEGGAGGGRKQLLHLLGNIYPRARGVPRMPRG